MTGIVDAHHHIWRQADLPWLVGPMQPRIFGPYEPIRRDYPIREYLRRPRRHRRRQVGLCADQLGRRSSSRTRRPGCSALPRKPAGRTRSSPTRISAWTTCARSSTGSTRYPLVRGVRMQLHWHENPLYRFAARADLCADPTIRRNVARLADYGWSFDLQVFAPQMPDAAGLAEACPKSPSCCSTPECWKTCLLPAARPGAPA